MSRKEVESISKEAERLGRVVGVRIAVPDGEGREPWELPASGRWAGPPIEGPYPEELVLVLGNQVYVPKAGLSPALRNRLICIAAFQNPEFYKAYGEKIQPTFKSLIYRELQLSNSVRLSP